MGSAQQGEIEHYVVDSDVDSLILENRDLRLKREKLNQNLGRRSAFLLNISKQFNKIRRRLKIGSKT